MIEEVAPDLEVGLLDGRARPLRAWLTTFHLVTAVLDPYTAESAALLPTVTRIFRVYAEADCRVAITVTCTGPEAREFLGPYADEFLVFTDPDRALVAGLGLTRLPALVHIRQDLSVAGCAEGWQPGAWRDVTDRLSKAMSWSRPVVPDLGDPAPFEGTLAAG
ncbi:MAG: hypothetical protein AB7H43_01000 [Acidimicrobiia bacterium]